MKVLVTRRILPEGMAILKKAGFDVELHDSETPMSPQKLRELARDCDGLLCMLNDPIDRHLLENSQLKVIANHAVGTDNVDLLAAEELDVVVTNTPGVLTEATADLAMALLLATARRIVEADAYLRSGHFEGWAPTMFVGASLSGKTLGIVGAGRIGQAVARRAEAFGLRVLSRGSRDGVPMAQILTESDFLSLHCPLTEKTHHLIGVDELRVMKSTAVLINTARGPVVDEEALVVALQEGGIAAAGLDVFEEEPKVHPALLAMKNVVLLPHIGSADQETRRKMSIIAAQSVVDVLEGRRPVHQVRVS